MQCLPRNKKSISEWTSRDKAFSEIAGEVRQIVEEKLEQKKSKDKTTNGDVTWPTSLPQGTLSIRTTFKTPQIPSLRVYVVKNFLPILLAVLVVTASIIVFAVKHMPITDYKVSSSNQQRTNNLQQTSTDSNLEISYNAVQSLSWEIPGQLSQYTLKQLPSKTVGAVKTNGYMSAPFYFISLTFQDVNRQSGLFVDKIQLLVKETKAIPHPTYIWAEPESTSTNYSSERKYEAYYIGPDQKVIQANYINPDYRTYNPGAVVLPYDKPDTIEVHVISRIEAGIVFWVQVYYHFYAGFFMQHSLIFQHIFEIAFVNPSDWKTCQFKGNSLTVSS